MPTGPGAVTPAATSRGCWHFCPSLLCFRRAACRPPRGLSEPAVLFPEQGFTRPNRRRLRCRVSSKQQTTTKPRPDTAKKSSRPQFSLDQKQLQRLADPQADPGRVFSQGIVSDVQQLASKLNTSIKNGLSTGDKADLGERARLFGANRLPETKPATFWELLAEAFEDPTVIILLFCGIFSILVDVVIEHQPNGWIEGAAILSAVAVVTLVTAGNNFQKEKQFQELNAVTQDIQVTVLRDGRQQQISTYDLLVGDVLVVDTGDILAADGMLAEGNELRLDESHLTGEADDVLKSERKAPMLLSGSKVLEGYGRMVVTAVGSASQQGIINTLVAGKDDANSQEDDGLRKALQESRN